MINKFDPAIVCCYLYVITKEGYPPVAANTITHLQQIRDLGFASAELEGIREDHLTEMYQLRHEIKAKIHDIELQVPYFCVVLPGLSAHDEKIRDSNLQIFSKGCEIASILNSKGVLDNAPLPPYLFPSDIPVVRHYGEHELGKAYLPKNLNWKKYWDSLVETYREACDIAGKYGLTYQMHPCLGVLAANTDAFLNFYNDIQRDNLKFNLDTANQYYMKENLALALTRLTDHINYIHLSDNRGQKVEHLPPGQGSIDWNRFFDTLNQIEYTGYIGIDVGGDESGIENIDEAFIRSAEWLSKIWSK